MSTTSEKGISLASLPHLWSLISSSFAARSETPLAVGACVLMSSKTVPSTVGTWTYRRAVTLPMDSGGSTYYLYERTA